MDSLKDVSRMERDFSTIPQRQKDYLKLNYSNRIEKVKECVIKNYLFLLKIVQPYSYMFKFQRNSEDQIFLEQLNVVNKDVIKMRSTLKLFIRDWSKDVSLHYPFFISFSF